GSCLATSSSPTIPACASSRATSCAKCWKRRNARRRPRTLAARRSTAAFRCPTSPMPAMERNEMAEEAAGPVRGERAGATDAVVGLPEVTLGIIPGAGGTQRLPRITGLATAIALIASGRRVKAPEAKRLGLIDDIATGELRAAALDHARKLAGRKRRISELA